MNVSKKIGPLVFDAFPILVLFRKQTGWERIRDILDEAVNSNFSHFVSLINVGEVYYSLLRDHGTEAGLDGLERIRTFPIEIVNPSYDHMLQASRFKAGGGLSYADCYTAALAFERGIPILTGDKEFTILEPKGVSVEWLPANR
jgi:predicted nucleic acid-binding protein